MPLEGISPAALRVPASETPRCLFLGAIVCAAVLISWVLTVPGVRHSTIDAALLPCAALSLVLGTALILGERSGVAMRLLWQIVGGWVIVRIAGSVTARVMPGGAGAALLTERATGTGMVAGDAAILFLSLAGLIVDRSGKRSPAVLLWCGAFALILIVAVSRVQAAAASPAVVLIEVIAAVGWFAAWRRRWGAVSPIAEYRTFSDVDVFPTQRLLEPPFMLFRGGPTWPLFWAQRRVRHCLYKLAIPLDVRPRSTTTVRWSPTGVWCGPVVQHFGHAIATFGGGLAGASRLPDDVPLVFSARPGEVPPPFFWDLLARFGVPRQRVLIINVPTRFARLTAVIPAELPFGRPPTPAYLDRLDALDGGVASHSPERIYVSRADAWKGKIAGELYIEQAFADSGWRVLRPETLPLREQLAVYRSAERLVFAEGSALHALQLLGRIGADVTVIARRRGSRLARAALAARVRSLAYVDVVSGLLHGVGRSGRPQPSAGLTIVDGDTLVRALADRGIDLTAVWETAAFDTRKNIDIAVWTEARGAHPLHRGDHRAIARSLASLGLSGVACP